VLKRRSPPVLFEFDWYLQFQGASGWGMNWRQRAKAAWAFFCSFGAPHRYTVNDLFGQRLRHIEAGQRFFRDHRDWHPHLKLV
jgi:hypothetical protein